MVIFKIVIVVAFISVAGASRCSVYTSWGRWGSCSRSCGGGTQTRTRCHLGTFQTGSQSCNQRCYNGGYYRYGRCQCSSWRTGSCCKNCRHISIANCVSGYQSCGGSPDGIRCTKCSEPYYPAGYNNGCRDCRYKDTCPSISNCKRRYCTTSSNTKCRECTDDMIRFKKSGSDTRCERASRCSVYTSWGRWGSCSRSCGGGTQTRTRCHLGTFQTGSQSCNQRCYNGGYYRYGRCQCSSWRTGSCCKNCRHISIANCVSGYQSCGGSPDGIRCTKCSEPYYPAGYNNGCRDCRYKDTCPSISNCKRRYCTTSSNTKCRECTDDMIRFKKSGSDTRCERMCAWDNHYCWPGYCTGGLTSGCSCAVDYRKIQTSVETTCQPSKPPSMLMCNTFLIGMNGRSKRANSGRSTNTCQHLSDFYGNFKPVLLQFEMTSQYNVNVSGYTKPSYIYEYKFGITDTIIHIQQKYLNGSVETRGKHEQVADSTLSKTVNFTRQDSGNINVSASIQSLQNGESLCFDYEALAGGYVKSKNLLTQTVNADVQYQKVRSSRTICYTFDDIPPKHCRQDENCPLEPLKIEPLVSRSPFIRVSFAGWSDPIPDGGSAAHASRIHSYTVNVNEVLSTKGQLKVDYSTMYTKIMNNASSGTSLYLKPDKPTLYLVRLEVKDNADNVKQARRFLLYDNTSFIEARKEKPLIVTSASKLTNFTWQTYNNDICLSWKDCFLNRFYVDGKILSPIQSSRNGSIADVYEHTSGLLSVYGTPNVYGIIKYLISIYINDESYSLWNEVPEFQKQTYCGAFNLIDGDKYLFKLRPVDIAGNIYTDNVTVYIDTSNPVVDIQGLSAPDEKNNSMRLHSPHDAIEFEALDPHSGIDSITWRIGKSNTSVEIATGEIDVHYTRVCQNGTSKCYCPEVGSCELYSYSLQLAGHLCTDRITKLANHDLYLSVDVTKHAHLTNETYIQLWIDVIDTNQCLASSGQGAIAAGVSAFLVITIVCVVVFVVVRRRKKHTEEDILLQERNLERYENLEVVRNSVSNETYGKPLGKSAEVFSKKNYKQKGLENYQDLNVNPGYNVESYDTIAGGQNMQSLRITLSSSNMAPKTSSEPRNIYEDIIPSAKQKERVKMPSTVEDVSAKIDQASDGNSVVLPTTIQEKIADMQSQVLPNSPENAPLDQEPAIEFRLPVRAKLLPDVQEECTEEHIYENTVLGPIPKSKH